MGGGWVGWGGKGFGLELSVEVCDYVVHMLGVISDGVCLLVYEGWMGWCCIVFIEDGFVG